MTEGNKQIVRGALRSFSCYGDSEKQFSQEALAALPHLTDTQKLIEKLEGMKFGVLDYFDDLSKFNLNIHNAAIDTIIKELRGKS